MALILVLGLLQVVDTVKNNKKLKPLILELGLLLVVGTVNKSEITDCASNNIIIEGLYKG